MPHHDNRLDNIHDGNYNADHVANYHADHIANYHADHIAHYHADHNVHDGCQHGRSGNNAGAIDNNDGFYNGFDTGDGNSNAERSDHRSAANNKHTGCIYASV